MPRRCASAPVDDIGRSRDEAKRLLKWAVVEHYRTWLSFDGVERRRIQEHGNELDRYSVRRIGREYAVTRGDTPAEGEGACREGPHGPQRRAASSRCE